MINPEVIMDATNGTTHPELQVATLAGGCFWCLEAVFDDLKGVSDVVSGYTGGTVARPSYEQVCTGRTGHAESVQITFDPAQVTYRELLEVFFSIHDPTTLNRQGADVGPQYRSAIFTHTPEQKAQAEQVIAELTAKALWDKPIVTEVAALTTFYPAEDYHQEYFRHNPNQGYCRMVIAPKVSKFRKHNLEKLKK
jgi:peptide-methionine (S)-S-oxide reductase